ncbi:hypothetical protein MBLNU13_g08497t2 [Cladosporium sp. NU13]
MALLVSMLMASAATMALDANSSGSTELDCYETFADATGCNRADGALDCSYITYISPESIDVARLCAKDDPGQWNAVLEAMPCVRALLADVVAASLEPENANVKAFSFDVRPSGSNQATSSGQDFQRTTPARHARLRRRLIVAGLTESRNTEYLMADESITASSQKLSNAQPKADPQLSFTRVVKHASPSFKREATKRPKWQPTTCTAPGVTCGNTGPGGPVSQNKMRSDSSCDTTVPSLRLALHEAQLSPKLPKRFLLLCASFGITCGDSRGSNDGSQNVDSGRASNLTAKSDSLPSPKTRKWFPLLCTSFGITCEDSGTSDGGPENADARQAPGFTVKRETQPSPKVPKWLPQFCTAPGITCAALDTSNQGSKNDHGNHPENSMAKREARPVPMAEARPAPQKGPPKWKPATCTVPGMTCGALDGVGASGSGDKTVTDRATVAIEQSKTGEHNKKREPDAAEQFWSGPGRGIFTDDEGDAIRIEDDEGSAT